MAQYRNFAKGAFGVYAGDVPLDATRPLFGSPSLKFEGTGYLRDPLPYGHPLDATFHNGDFSIDGWARFDGLASGMSTAVIIGKAQNGNQSYYLGVNNNNQLALFTSSNGTGGSITTYLLGTVPTGSFFHFEATRVGSTFYGFINGVLGFTGPISDFYQSSAPTTIGRIEVGGFEFQWLGNIRELRVTRAGRHTANYSVPTSPPSDDPAEPLNSSVVLMLHGNEIFFPIAIAAPQPKRLAGEQSFGGVPTPVRAILMRGLPARQVDPWSGTGRIVGTVKEKNTPVNTPLRRRVWLLREREAQFIREAVSDATTGVYEFKNIEMNAKYSVIAFDHEHEYRAVIADNLTPELMV